MLFIKSHDNVFIIIYFPFLLLTLATFGSISSFIFFLATSNPAIVHHCMLPYKMAPVSLFIHEKRHPEKGLLN